MIDRMKARMGSEEGFTLIELLVVIIILGILLAIAVPSYLAFKDRANKTAAQANVRTLVDSIEQYNADNYPGSTNDPDSATSTTDSGYAGMTIAELKTSYDQAIPAADWVAAGDANRPAAITIPAATSNTYCAVAQVGSWYAWKLGPTGDILAGTTAANVCTATP